MLFFLRNIRRKLMGENRILTYVMYALGEFILVVAGILIALQIDDWNEKRILQAQEQLYLKRLVAENEQDLVTFSSLKQDINNGIESIEQFCRALNDDKTSDSVVIDFAVAYLEYGSIVPIFSTSRSTFDDLSFTGNLRVISNLELRDRVVRHYAEITRIQERLRINNDWALALDGPFYYEFDFMRLEPSAAHLFPKGNSAELVREMKRDRLKYISNASAGYWVDLDAIKQITDLEHQTGELIKQLKAELMIIKNEN